MAAGRGLQGDLPADTRLVSSHCLDPLDEHELASVVDIVRADDRSSSSDLFVLVKLVEPSKAEVDADQRSLERRALAVMWRHTDRTLSEIVVSLGRDVVESWSQIDGAKAPTLATQVDRVLELVRGNEEYVAGLRRRGVADTSGIHLEVWPFGGLLPDRFAGRRVVYTPAWERPTPDSNPYAHPVHGYYAVVDLDTLELLEIEEHDPRPIPAAPGHYRAHSIPRHRSAPRYEITSRDGAGFAVEGRLVRWQNWRIRVGFCPKEGLLIQDVRYLDGGRERRIAHRLSMAELVIPYADPSPGSYRKNAFDVGEVHMGINTNSLRHGCDCLGDIRYLDAAYVDNLGEVRTIENAICLHTEDTGLLWKHTDTDGHVEVRRGSRLVVSSIYTVDNYEYGYYWYFGLDGSIEFEAKFTGIVLTLAGEPGTAAYGTALAPGLIAPNHQHVFCARLDLDVDGPTNVVTEIDAVAPAWGSANPYGGAFVEARHRIESEADGRRHANPASARHWTVSNPASLNAQGTPVAYKLLPRSLVTPLAHETSSIGKRAGFMYADLWVTALDDDELYPAGDHPFQSAEGQGLPTWIQDDADLNAADVVVWHVFGITHVPRLEDWPVMPADRAGFVLTPFGFFDRNPALDIGPPEESCVPSAGAGIDTAVRPHHPTHERHRH